MSAACHCPRPASRPSPLRAGPPVLRPEDLDDPAQFLTLRDVPVFVTHDALDPPGPSPEPRRTAVDRATLERLARNTNARAAGRPFMPAKLQIGHTLPKKPLVVQHQGVLKALPAAYRGGAQPAIVGFASNFRVGDYDGRPCLFCDWHIFLADVAFTRTFPFRSIEREPEEYISGISLLRTEPALNLGALHYSKKPANLYGTAVGLTPTKTGRLVSVHSKTQEPKCSQWVSDWRTGKANGDTFKGLAWCRAVAKTRGLAAARRAAGHEAGAQALEHRAAAGKVGKGARQTQAAHQRSVLHQRRAARAASRITPDPGAAAAEIREAKATWKAPSPLKDWVFTGKTTGPELAQQELRQAGFKPNRYATSDPLGRPVGSGEGFMRLEGGKWVTRYPADAQALHERERDQRYADAQDEAADYHAAAKEFKQIQAEQREVRRRREREAVAGSRPAAHHYGKATALKAAVLAYTLEHDCTIAAARQALAKHYAKQPAACVHPSG